MTSSFRRSTVNKSISNLQKEHDTILSELSTLENTTDNNSIMDILNPAFKDLDMNNNNINNVNNININTVNGVGILTSPIYQDLDMGLNDIKFCKDINVQSISSNGDIVMNNVVDMSYNDIKNINGVISNTVETKELIGYHPYKSISPGLEVNKDGRYNITVITQSTTPVLLFKCRYQHYLSVYDGRFMSQNDAQSKIWTCPAICTVFNSQIDKNIGGSGVSSIGGTTRSATIDFGLNNYTLEIWVSPNFSDYTVSVFDFNLWTDYPQ